MENKNKIKILIINYEYPPLGGGGGIATRDLAVEWARHPAVERVDVITSSFRGLKKFEIADKVNIYRVRIFFRKSRDAATFLSLLTYLPGAFIKGLMLFRKNRYAVINTHFVVPSGPVGFLLGRIFSVPNIVSLHGGEIYDPSKKMSPHRSRFWSSIVKYLLNKADGLVAQSSNTRDNAIKYYNPVNDIRIIPLPFQAPSIRGEMRKRSGAGRNEFVIVTCGRLVKRKAMDILVMAFAKIKPGKCRLIIMGDGPERQGLEDLVRENGLEGRVLFTGFVDEAEKYGYLNSADIFALVSMHEGFGIVYMEAMYCGLPVICSSEGGQTDFLKHMENAVVINVGDADACADAIRLLYDNNKLRQNMALNNKAKVKDFFAPKIAEQYIKVFQNTVLKIS